MTENTDRVSARTRKRKRLQAEEEQLALESAEAERLSQFRSSVAFVDISSSSQTRTRAQHESREQDLSRRREILLRMLDGLAQSVDVEAPTEAVQEMAIADDDDDGDDDGDDEFEPVESQGTQSTDPGTPSQQTFPILNVGVPPEGWRSEEELESDVSNDYAPSSGSAVSYTFRTEAEEEGSIEDVNVYPAGWDTTEADEARARGPVEICTDCAREGHPSKRSPKCAQHVHTGGAPPFLTEEESVEYYFGKSIASYKTNLSTLIKEQFVVGTASFSNTEVIDRFNEYVHVVSVSFHQFSLIFLAFVDVTDDVQEIDFELLRAFYNQFMGRTQLPSRLKQGDNLTDKQKAALERRETRLAERAKFGQFLEPIQNWRREFYDGHLPGANKSHIKHFEDMVLNTFLTNIQVHLWKGLKYALGKLLHTRLRREQGVSNESAAIARRHFYKLYDAENKQAREEVEDDDTLPLDLGAQVESEVTAKEGEAEAEDDENVVMPEHAVEPSTTPAIATDAQLRYIQGDLPPGRLFAKNDTRYSQGKEWDTAEPRRVTRRANREELGKTPDHRQDRQHPHREPTSFNNKRRLNSTTKRAVRAKRRENDQPEISYPVGTTLADGKAETLAEDFYRDRCRGINTVAKQVAAFKEINIYLKSQNITPYTLLPTFSAKAKHLSLNMSTLFDLLASFGKQGLPNQGDFNANIAQHFFNIFNLSPDLRPQTGTTVSESFTATEYVERFTFQSASSDGKDASVKVYKWVRRRKPPDKAKDRKQGREEYQKEQKRKAEEKRKNDMAWLRQIQSNNSVKMVGIDPGRKDILSGILGKNLNKRDKEIYTLSNAQWAVITKRNRIMSKEKSYAITANVYDWRRNIPSSRTSPMETIRYLFAKGSKLKDLYKLYHSLKYKQLRRQSYMRRRAAVKRAMDEMLRKFQPNKNEHIFIAFGSAIFSQVSRGYAPGGNVAAFFKELKSRRNVHPVYVDEYHTSQASVLESHAFTNMFRCVQCAARHKDLFTASSVWGQSATSYARLRKSCLSTIHGMSGIA